MDIGADEPTCTATLHHLIITLHVGGNEYDLGPEARPRLPEEFHGIGASSSFLGVPEDHSFGLNVLVDQARYRWSEGLLLIRADPNEEPN
jgi:hypothetical protein